MCPFWCPPQTSQSVRPSLSSSVILYSSKSPLTKILTYPKPLSSRIFRTFLLVSAKSPLSNRTPPSRIALCFQFFGDYDCFFCTCNVIVGVYEEGGFVWEGFGERAEGIDFFGVRHDEGVCHGAEDWDAVSHAC